MPPPPRPTLFPYTTLFRSNRAREPVAPEQRQIHGGSDHSAQEHKPAWRQNVDRKSTRLNSSHPSISYAVFCLKKKNRELISLRAGQPAPVRARVDLAGAPE